MPNGSFGNPDIPIKDSWLRRKYQEINGAGKGDRARAVDKARFDAEYERIFGKREVVNVWDPNDPDHPAKQRSKDESEVLRPEDQKQG